MTYCINTDCPFEDCPRHLNRAKQKHGKIKAANYDGVCKRYIIYLAERFWKVKK